MKPIYLHVSYITSKGDNNFTYGDICLQLNKPVTITDIRGYLLDVLKEDKPGIVFQIPTILSMTKLSRKMYKMLTAK